MVEGVQAAEPRTLAFSPYEGHGTMQGAGTTLIELDAVSAPAFIAATRIAIDQAQDHTFVVVDCLTVTFMDSSAYHAMIDVTRYARERGHPLVVRNVSRLPAWVLSFCDWDDELTVEPAAA
jgi:anti-anti-sigma factor